MFYALGPGGPSQGAADASEGYNLQATINANVWVSLKLFRKPDRIDLRSCKLKVTVTLTACQTVDNFSFTAKAGLVATKVLTVEPKNLF